MCIGVSGYIGHDLALVMTTAMISAVDSLVGTGEQFRLTA
jgi:hypothetical protein